MGMPEGLEKYKKYYKPKAFTSTTYVYEPYKETTYAPEPTLGDLPKYYPKPYENEHNPNIPYREIEDKYEAKNQPYQHVFPKYTTTYYTSYSKYEKPYEPRRKNMKHQNMRNLMNPRKGNLRKRYIQKPQFTQNHPQKKIHTRRNN